MTHIISSVWVTGASLSILWKWVSYRQRAISDFASSLWLGGRLIEMRLTPCKEGATTTAGTKQWPRSLRLLLLGVFGENAGPPAGSGDLQIIWVRVRDSIHLQKDPPETCSGTRQAGAEFVYHRRPKLLFLLWRRNTPPCRSSLQHLAIWCAVETRMSHCDSPNVSDSSPQRPVPAEHRSLGPGGLQQGLGHSTGAAC